MTTPQWLDWAQRLQAIAQSGLAFNQDKPFEIERFEAVSKVAAEMMAANGGLEEAQLTTLFAGQKGYATPKIDVRGVVFKDDKILLVKELSDGGWTLPGGFADVGDTPSEAVEREVWEESGFKVKANKILALYDRSHQGHPPYIFHLYKIFIRCQLLGGSAADSIETEGAAFFARDEIPPLSIARVLPKQIEHFFEHHAHPDWPRILTKPISYKEQSAPIGALW